MHSHPRLVAFDSLDRLVDHPHPEGVEAFAHDGHRLVGIEPRVPIEQESARQPVAQTGEQLGVALTTHHDGVDVVVSGHDAELVEEATITRVPAGEQRASHRHVDTPPHDGFALV